MNLSCVQLYKFSKNENWKHFDCFSYIWREVEEEEMEPKTFDFIEEVRSINEA
jgi:hypothetical protein